MLWQRILIGVAVAIVGAGVLCVLVYFGLVDVFGKHLGSTQYGRSVTEHRYLVDQKARRRIRWGTLLSFLVLAACIFACAWSTILTPEQFGKFFPGL
jgi:hypothetical protein